MGATAEDPKSTGGVVLMTLAAGQFLMTLDSSVMNVSIATVAKDVGTTVTGIQTAITFYTLVMASLMITGATIGAMIGRKRARMCKGFLKELRSSECVPDCLRQVVGRQRLVSCPGAQLTGRNSRL